MVRDDLYITVPSFFRCPISLDVMKSPVSLCTGVTYDRSSIQKWLDGGNSTCPATMQVLQTKELVPNRNLHRLIQIWSATVPHSAADESAPAISRDDIRAILARGCSALEDVITVVYSFAKESKENREFLAGLEGFVPLLAEFLAGSKSNAAVAGAVVGILSLILCRIQDRERLKTLFLTEDCLTALVEVFVKGKNPGERSGSVRILEAIAGDTESKMRIAEAEGLLPELVRSISPETDTFLSEATLSCLTALAGAPNKKVKAALVRLNVVPALRRLLEGPGPVEKALRLLEVVSWCKEGREEVIAGGAVEAVVGHLMKLSAPATEYAVGIMWGACCMGKDERAREAVIKANGVTKVLLLLQSNCSPAVRLMLAELLKVFRGVSRSSATDDSRLLLPRYDTNTIHVMPF